MIKKAVILLSVVFPLWSYGAITCAEAFQGDGLIVHPSNMQNRKDGNVQDVLTYLGVRKETGDQKDNRTETQKLLDTRDFKSWFDFKNRSSQYFKEVLGLKPALVKHVSSPQEGLLAKLMMIRQAKYTVDLTYYIFKADPTGYAILNELKAAVQRGVSVRLMVDSLGSINIKAPDHPELKALVDFAKSNAGFMKDRHGKVTDQKARVEVISFRSVNPIQIATGTARKLFREGVNKVLELSGSQDRVETVYINPNRRTHDKILITDQNFPEISVAIIGGRNISDHYYGIPQVDSHTFADLEVVVKNDPAALSKMGRDAITTNIADLYEQLYFHSGNRLITAGLLRKLFGYGKQHKKMEEAEKTVAESTSKTLQELGEDIKSHSFGQKYLTEGFSRGEVDLTYTFDNVLRSRSHHELDPLKITIDSKRNLNHIAANFEQYLAAEQKHIVIVSPYLWLSPDQITKFKVWLGRDSSRKLTIITNSIMTSDNMAAQTLVDAVLGPNLVLDRNYIDPRDNKIYSYKAEQLKLYEYGRIDATDLGGKKPYGKLHAKGVYLESQQASAITTYNADPRSQYLNSETGLVVFDPIHSQQVKKQMDQWIQDSHEWGSAEYHAIRKHEKLGAMKRKAAENVQTLYKWIVNLGLEWLI